MDVGDLTNVHLLKIKNLFAIFGCKSHIRDVLNKLMYDDKLDVSFYKEFISQEEAQQLFSFVDKLLGKKNNGNRRTKKTFGEGDIDYDINFGGKIVTYHAEDWSRIPPLLDMKRRIENVIGEKLTVCAIQYYPNQKVGIKPHRDKEMVPGTKICGLSLGATRTLVMVPMRTPVGGKTHKLPLPSGSLYIFNPPTNDYWLHSIPSEGNLIEEENLSENVTEARISLTYRNYVPSKHVPRITDFFHKN